MTTLDINISNGLSSFKANNPHILIEYLYVTRLIRNIKQYQHLYLHLINHTCKTAEVNIYLPYLN